MDPHAGKIVLNGAPSQLDRWLRALDPGFARVDGRSFVELLDFAPKFGELIHFYNLKDHPEGDWVDFFLTDPTLILASIEATDLESIEASFDRHASLTRAACRENRKFELLRSTFQVVQDVARQVNQWLGRLTRCPRSDVARLLLGEITLAIEMELSTQLRTLRAYDEGAGLPGKLGQPIGLDWQGFLKIWQIENVTPDGSIYRGRTQQQQIDHALPYLRPILDAFLQTISDWQAFASANLAATLEASNHRPQIGLYIAFAQLFQTAQNTINTLSSRYVRFYYQDILREARRGPIPDRVYLTFTLAEDEEVLSAEVPRGNLFPAGEDSDGEEILYAADRELTVTAAQVAKLRTIRVVSADLLTDLGALPPRLTEVGDTSDLALELRVPQRILASEIAIADELTEVGGTPDAADATTVNSQAAWATFGRTEEGTTASEVTTAATLGFAVASRYLLLSGGRRIITLMIHFEDPTLPGLLAALADATGWSENDVFQTVLEQAFDLYLSTSSGWFRVEVYEVVEPSEPIENPSSPLDFKPSRFALQVELPASAPPIEAYDPESDQGADEGSLPVSEDPEVVASNPDPGQPTLKAYLRQEPVVLGAESPPTSPPDGVSVYPLSLLAGMEVRKIRIQTQVVGLTELQLENTDGTVDTTSPYLLFGGLPVVGSYLSIHSDELFVKRLKQLQIELDWFNLPQNETGFEGYYRDYVIGLDGEVQPDLFNNRKFRVDLSVRQPGTWNLAPSSPADAFLFRTQDDCSMPVPEADGRLCATTGFDDLELCPEPRPSYYDPAASSIRLELVEPPYAFGNDLYAENVLAAVIEDLPNAEKCQVDCGAECAPLEEAAKCIESCILCLSVCQGKTDPDQPTEGPTSPPKGGSVERCLERCIACLVKTFLEGFRACYQRCVPSPDGVGEATLDLLEARVQALIAAKGFGRSKALLRLPETFQELVSPSEAGCLKACWQKYRAILEAVACVESCGAECRGNDSETQCVTACLEDCQAQLTRAHAACLEVCMADCLSLKNDLKYPNEPYLPQLQGLTVSYSADCALSGGSTSEACGSFYLLWPFGGTTQPAPDARDAWPLLPRFPNPGNLYLGFSRLIPPQTLTLLFQMTAGDSAGRDLPPVTWEYLDDDCWRVLQPKQVLEDTTHGLESTGIVALSLPTYDPAGSMVLSDDEQWLRASVECQPGRFPETVAIDPQVTPASWVGESGTGEHLRQPLPAHTITSSVEDLADIEIIDQPIESFGGRPAESRREFDIRVGERLRHKDRAILAWDDERLVLERFPTVWKVQALPARNPEQGHVPGAVLIVIVPGPDSTEVMDPTLPLAPSSLLSEIERYLEARTSPFVDLSVVNPIYVRIEVKARVRFVEDEESGGLIDELNVELVRYLSPWFYDVERAARGGSYASEADITEFIQTRSYVASVDAIDFTYQPTPQEIESDWYFLTSAEAHRIIDADVREVEGVNCYT